MATTQNNYTGNGSNKLFSITFPYLDTPDIDVYLNGTLQTVTTQYFFANATTIEFVTAPANGATITLIRVTPDLSPEATFFPGSSIKASDLNDNFNQIFYIAQETVNRADTAVSTANLALPKSGGTMTGAIVLPADPSTNLQAATKQYVDTIAATGGAGVALLKTGGTMTGNLVFAAGQPTATTSTKNIVQLTDSAASTSTTTAATPAAVKVAKDAADAAQSTANTANTTANAALPKSGGTMTGVLNFDLALQTKASTSTYGITQLTNSTTSTDTGTAATAASAKAAADLANTAQATANAALPKAGGTMTGNLEIGTAGSLTFEGATADGFETTLAVVDPTADRTITLPDVTGTVVTTGDTGTVTSTMILDGTIVDADINASAAIVDTKLATISTAGKVNNSATTATNANTASAIVARDASGNFSAGTITASLTGNASTVTTNANLTGDVTSVGNATTIAAGVIVDADVNASAAIVDTKLATIATAGKVSNSATTAASANTASAIVARDASGNFTAGTITAALTGAASSNVLKAGDTMTGVLAVTAGTAALPGIAVSGDPNTGIYSPGADQLAISTNGTGRLFVDASGNISLSSTTSLISTNTADTADNKRLILTGGGTVGVERGAYINLQGNEFSGGGNAAIVAGDNGFIGFSTGAGNERLRITSTGALNFVGAGTAGSTQAVSFNGSAPVNSLVIDSSGRLGIGTSSPTVNLHVVGASGSGGIQIGNSADSQYHYINFGGDTPSDNAWQIGRSPTGGVGPNNGFYIYDLKNGLTRLSIDASGRVGIGDSAPESLLHLKGSNATLKIESSVNTGYSSVEFDRAADDTHFAIYAYDSSHASQANNVQFYGYQNGNIQFITNSNATPRLTITNGGILQISSGITFPATAVAATDANTLDDYEEGTFTPTLTFGGGSTGIAYLYQLGQYTKVGNLVTVTIRLALTSKGSSTGNALIESLPFTVSSATSGQLHAGCAIQVNNFSANTAITTVFAIALSNTSTISFRKYLDSGSIVVLADTDFVATADIVLTSTYRV
jgi:hypothetical protein